MDYTVVWSPEAIEDVDAIATYIARDSVFYAGAVVSKILAASRSISEQPLIGRIVPEIGNENIRERFIYSYRLVYKIQQDEITIAAVIHGKRLLDNIMERLE
jgi:toxin ParE1/3/4